MGRALLFAAALIVPAGPGTAAEPLICLERAQMVEALAVRFDEHHWQTVVLDETTVAELYVGDGTWTILTTTAGGVSCIVAIGRTGSALGAVTP